MRNPGIILFLGFIFASTAFAHSSEKALEQASQEKDSRPLKLYVKGANSRQADLVGVAETSSEGSVGKEVFESRPILRPGELIETVPGMIATQHAGGGKANQYFFRGFNLDHGTDFRTEVEGMPVNLTTHGHGQGYTDLNFLIPELVSHIDFHKGVSHTEKGNFATAGSADFFFDKSFDTPVIQSTLGEDDYARIFTAGSTETAGGTLLGGLELFHYDGPWVEEENSRKFNAVLRYSKSEGADSFDVLGMAYRGIWDSSDQIPERAVEQGTLPFLGTVDPTTGGDSDRFSLSGRWSRSGESGNYRANAYAVYYDLDLYSNFTYFLDNPEEGDQFYQEDERIYMGGEVAADHPYDLHGTANAVTYGLQLRHDHIPTVALRKTAERRVLETVREDEVEETHIGLFLKNDTRLNDWARGFLGVRGDFVFVDVESDMSVNSGSDDDAQVSPNAGLVLGPWADTELYLNGGFGFHSNDARGATTTIDPNTGESVDPVDLLTEARGAEVGVRSTAIDGLISTVTLWYLELDNELVFVGDAGTTEVLGASERHGVEFTNYYQPVEWMSLYADYAYTHPRFEDDSTGEDKIPNSIEHTFVTGFNVGKEEGLQFSGKWRHLGTRTLVEDGSARAPVTSIVDLRLGYNMSPVRFFIDVFNVLDEDDFDIAYFYTSRLPGEGAAGVEDRHFHPVEPRQVRTTLQYQF